MTPRPRTKARRGVTAPVLTTVERCALADWLSERAAELRSERMLIRAEFGCDIVRAISKLANEQLALAAAERT